MGCTDFSTFCFQKKFWIFSAKSKSEALFGQSDSHCEASLVVFNQYRLETPDLCTSLLGLCSLSCVLRELFRWQPGLFFPQVVISWGGTLIIYYLGTSWTAIFLSYGVMEAVKTPNCQKSWEHFVIWWRWCSTLRNKNKQSSMKCSCFNYILNYVY